MMASFNIIITTMTALTVSLTFLSLSRAVPLNSTNVSRHAGLCEYVRQQGQGLLGGFVPQCDEYGNFLPQQCSGSTGFCWCVDTITGQEIPNTRTPPGSVPINCNREYYCPYGWSRLGKYCYVFIDSLKTWFEAEGYCLFEGANLASVHSYEENHFIQALTRADTHNFPHAWIGGSDAVHLGVWMWSDGTNFKYEYWYKEFNVDRTDHCLMMNYGYERKWNYASCDDTYPFVCAKKI